MLQICIRLKICLIIAMGIVALNSTANSQTGTEGMVSFSLDNSFSMVKTDKQKNLLQKIKERETTTSVKIFKVEDINEMANSTSLRFDDKIIYSISSGENKQSKGSNLWQGKSNEAEANTSTLIFSEDDVTGSIWLNGKLYKIEPLGNSIHAFIENNQSKSLNCPQPVEMEEDGNGNGLLNKGEAIQTDPPVIDVLVAYTTAAKNASGNINSLIQLAIAEANQSYQNSDVNVKMNLVYTYEVNYTESGNTLTDLNRFTNTSDGYMDNVHTLRNTYGADVCQLIISNTY